MVEGEHASRRGLSTAEDETEADSARERVTYERPRIRSVAERSLFAGPASGGWNMSAQGEGEDVYDETSEEDPGYRVPLCSLWENETSYLLEIEIPGVPPDAIDLEISVDEIVVSAATPTSIVPGTRSAPYFGRLSLPEHIDPEGADATFEHGVLGIRLHKAVDRARKRIVISHEEVAAQPPAGKKARGGSK
jgi:HSP20 family protein